MRERERERERQREREREVNLICQTNCLPRAPAYCIYCSHQIKFIALLHTVFPSARKYYNSDTFIFTHNSDTFIFTQSAVSDRILDSHVYC